MPSAPSATFGFPIPAGTDGPDVPHVVGILADAIDLALDRLVPIGTIVFASGSILSAPGYWDFADGDFIDGVTYPRFLTVTGHVYNNGVNPGVNGLGHQLVRKPDMRGRSPVGASNYGPLGNASGNARVQLARGADTGEVLHALSVAEMPAHAHAGFVSDNGSTHDPSTALTANAATSTAAQGMSSVGGGGSHNSVHPVQAHNAYVRIK